MGTLKRTYKVKEEACVRGEAQIEALQFKQRMHTYREDACEDESRYEEERENERGRKEEQKKWRTEGEGQRES